jgi:hypothetical protein
MLLAMKEQGSNVFRDTIDGEEMLFFNGYRIPIVLLSIFFDCGTKYGLEQHLKALGELKESLRKTDEE